jgi:hypothetical protein
MMEYGDWPEWSIAASQYIKGIAGSFSIDGFPGVGEVVRI